jgi:catechol 2,3-dioxygenase-like lactoylglutathione lyase family enzyme
MISSMPLLRIVAVWLLATLPGIAQRSGPNVTFGHVHINAADPDKTIAFWTDVIGTSTWSRDSLKGVNTLGVLILIARAVPTGPSAGSAIDRIGFKVPDLEPFLGKLAKTGFKSFQPASDRLMIDGPDGVRIELTEDSSVYAPLQFDRIHFNATQPKDIQAWYAKLFGARPGGEDQPNSFTAGVAFSLAHADSVAPTAGRAIDHIAFEIKNLESFCQKLAAEGIRFDSPFQSLPQLKLSSAFLTDPSGARIELTEGLAY